MRFLALEFPPPEFIIFAVFLLIGLIGKIIEFAGRVRQRSLEQQRREGGFAPEAEAVREPERAPEPPAPPVGERPPAVELPLRLVPVRRPPRRRREAAPPTVARPFVPGGPKPARRPAGRRRGMHPAVRLLRAGPESARQAVVMAEILGPPKAFRRPRPR